jgi:hypothetical protein
MKRAAFVVLAAGLLAGCSSVRCWFLKGECLTYEQYLSIDQSANPAPTADQVLKTLGAPLAVRDRDGIRRRIDYYAYSLNGDLKIAEFRFDANEKLVEKQLW